MQVFTFITQKGGSGKTTSLINIAVAAAVLDKARVVIIDLDPQKSTLLWWETREKDNIGAIDIQIKDLEKSIEILKSKNVQYVFMDTPARAELINTTAIRYSDFCLLPCQPSLLDMRAAKATVASIKQLDKKGGFIITRANSRGYRVEDTVTGLGVHGLPVCKHTIVDRTVYRDAYALGEGVLEYDPKGKATEEIKAIWEWIKKISTKKMELAA